jgi:malonate-semialdehyde dehydrogenase (acetylating)/methylmalonate-semialdehyde dehydrogenase
MTDLSHFIDGARVPGKSGRFGDVFNPATGEVQARSRHGAPPTRSDGRAC